MTDSFDLATATHDEIMDHIKRLRLASEQAEARFLSFLYDIETTREDIWKGNGIDRFDQFLKSYHVVDPTRYNNFCAGLKKVGHDPVIAQELGAGAVAAARIIKEPTPEKTERLRSFVKSFEVVNGVKPSEQHAAKIIRSLEPITPRVEHTATEISRLRAENAQLKAQLRERDRRIVELEELLAQKAAKVSSKSSVMPRHSHAQ